jgi:hypothetical protein
MLEKNYHECLDPVRRSDNSYQDCGDFAFRRDCRRCHWNQRTKRWRRRRCSRREQSQQTRELLDQRHSNSALSFVRKIGAKLAMGKHMGEWGTQNVSSMSHQDWAQWRHLILKLRWIGLEDEARRLQSAVSTMHVKAEVARSDIARTRAH